MNCPNCGAEVRDVDRFCGRCGAEIRKEAGEASYQQTNYQEGSQQQGTYQQTNYQQPYQPLDTRKSRLVAGILQLVLGWGGVGRFYLGYNSIAIAQILVTIFTCGIGAIWPFVDSILILAGQVQTDADGVPLKD
ncbi:TM2 domain-containing protein [Niameybacter massiliensis]|uniref:TM2 domain-containing protein n=1 Tax=Holtiella tumoricola TaxID=3018743 RepID=A0AA42IZZ1_9FIRM|nr:MULTISPECIES: TM2 domain-containing protein [Lachnospirales]MDA3730563.1 TM2 domain-containing protein [Holtiella tumoricola]